MFLNKMPPTASPPPSVLTYTPVYFAEEAALPAPNGGYGKIMATNKLPEVQRADTNCVLTFINEATVDTYLLLSPLPNQWQCQLKSQSKSQTHV